MTAEITFGIWLRQRRRMLDLTQQSFADQVGCARSTLRRIEADDLKPSKELADILLGKLGIPEIEHPQWIHFARGSSGLPKESIQSVSSQLLSNLPASITTFIGRDKEQAEVIDLISKNRMVTLSGIGGIGKTSLALRMGQKLLNDYPHGIWCVALDSLSDPALVPQTVASIFDIREGSDRPLIERLTDSLREKNALLILDNCEHMLDACSQLSTTLLTNCPNLKILATSREILNVAGEAAYPMPSLSMPEKDDGSIEKLTAYESIQLFVARAALALTSFTLTKQNAQTVVEICRKVEGIPLAIELAASRVNILQVAEILKQLQNSFTLLSTANRTTLSRHQTLQASMDWSWGLLYESEQTFMRQLSIFAGGWTLGSAQAICDGDVLTLTSALAKKSLIMVNQETGRETRYRFHEIVRQYTRDKMFEEGDEDNVRIRHLRYFVEFSEQAESALKGLSQAKWMARLKDERDNIRTALEWANQTDAEAGLYISGRLNRFWEIFDIREGARWLGEFVRKPESRSYPFARAKALYAQGMILPALQQYDGATSAAQECLDLYRACDDKPGEIDGLLALGYAPDIRHVALVELHQQALSLSRSLGDLWRQARTLFQLSWVGNDYQQRIIYLKEAVALFRKVGDLQSLARSLSNLGYFSMLNGDFESTQRWTDEALVISQHLNNKAITAGVLGNIAIMAIRQGDYRSAHVNLQECITIAREVGDRRSLLWLSSHLGFLYLREGQTSEARNVFISTAQDFYEDKNDSGVIFNFEGMASLYVAIEKPEHAARLIGWADATREKNADTRPPIEQADADRDIAAIITKIGSSAFEIAYNEGRAMTLDEAVAFALRES